MRVIARTISVGIRIVLVTLGGCAPGGLLSEPRTASRDGVVHVERADSTPAESSITRRSTKGDAATKSKMSKESEGSVSQQMAKARGLEETGKFDEARVIYERLTNDYPQRPEPFHRLGVVEDHRRRHNEAQQMYLKALKLKPNDPEILNDLGYCLYLQGDLSNAEKALERATDGAPRNSRYRNNLALVHGHQGRLEDALADFRRAGSEADAQYNLGFILAAKSDMEGAKACFQKALVADSSFDRARKALRNFDRAENDPAALADWDESDSDVRMIPYVEPDANDTSAKAPANVASAAPRSGSRALQSQAHAMVQERLAAVER